MSWRSLACLWTQEPANWGRHTCQVVIFCQQQWFRVMTVNMERLGGQSHVAKGCSECGGWACGFWDLDLVTVWLGEILLAIEEEIESKALLGSSWQFSQQHYFRGSAVNCKTLQSKARVKEYHMLSQAGVTFYLEALRKHPSHRWGRSPWGLHPAHQQLLQVLCSSLWQGRIAPGAPLYIPIEAMELCHFSVAEDMPWGKCDECTQHARQEEGGLLYQQKEL